MPYNNYWTRSNPGILVVLVDQSEGMNQCIDGIKKSDIVTNLANRLLVEIGACFIDGSQIKPTVFISVCGYSSDSAYIIRNGFNSDFLEKPLRIDTMNKRISDGAGNFFDVEYSFPVSLFPEAKGNKPMAEGFKLAHMEIDKFFKKKVYQKIQLVPRPIIINICEGIPKESFDIVREKVNKFSSFDIPAGNPIIINIVLADSVKNNSCILPSNTNSLPYLDIVAKFYYDISSLVPKANDEHEIRANSVIDNLEMCGFEVSEKSRNLYYNIKNTDVDILTAAVRNHICFAT